MKIGRDGPGSDISPHYSITSSARASSDGGRVRPSALAVFRFDRQFVRGQCLHGQVGRLLAFEDAVDVARRSPKFIDRIRPVGDKAAAW